MMSESQIRPDREIQLRNHLKWFLLARVVVVSCFLGTVAFIQLVSSETGNAFSTNGLLAVIGLGYTVTLVSALVMNRVRQLTTLAFAQIGVDTVLTTAAIFFTGGMASPFSFLYCLTIFGAALMLFTRGAAVAALLGAGAYTTLVFGLAAADIGPALDAHTVARLLISDASFFVLAYLAGVLTQRLHDVETRLEVERTEHDRVNRLQETLTRHIGSGVVTTDADGRITSANATALTFIGTDIAGVPGRDIGSVFAPLHLTSEARAVFLQSAGAAPIEFTYATTEGRELLLRCSAAPIQDTYGHAIGALYIFQDVTVLRQLEHRYQSDGDEALAEAAQSVVDDTDDDAPPIDGFVGRSPAMQQIRSLLNKVAPSDATVLLCGESGTGKEVAARAIHAKSPRRDKPFVAINCGAIPEHLIESELFGHVKGAFTGAVANRPGFFRAADGGTVFLDEIGELPLALQVKLLRVLQERVFKPVGSEIHVAVNVRVIAATNKDLAREVATGRFREDLFYRLNVISIELPPLRDRSTDVPPLIRHFLREFSDLHRKHVTRLSVPAARRLLNYHYPGNIRELANVIEHAVTMCEGETVHETHLPVHVLQPPRASTNGSARPIAPSDASITASAPSTAVESAPVNGTTTRFENLDQYLADHEKAIILRALEQSGGVKKRAADLLGINYRSFRHRLSKYGLHNGDAHPD